MSIVEFLRLSHELYRYVYYIIALFEATRDMKSEGKLLLEGGVVGSDMEGVGLVT